VGRRDFGRYKIAEELGRGAMGVVYRATDPLLGRSVAIKAINQAYLENLGVSAAEYYQRFRREAEVAGGLNHPHIVKIFDLGPDYIVMELVEGESLRAVLRARTHFSLSRILEMVAQVADALDCAHAQGIVHRDIKPANIMRRPDGSVTVMDFGLARVESSTLTAAGEILGSASYMAPELVLGAQADAKSDIFALGVVAYELMTGERPFAGPSITSILYKIVQEPPPSAHGVDLNVPPDYDDIFAKVLAKEAAGRYQKAGDFASELTLKKWVDRDPVLTARAGAELVPGSVEEAGQEPSVLEELVPPVVLPEAKEPVAEEPAAAATFIMQAPEAGTVAPAPSEAPAAAPNAQAETTVVLPAPGAPPRAPFRVQFSGQTTWGPDSRHPKAGERTAILRAPLPPAPAAGAEATLVMAAPPLAEDAGAATLVLPPSPPVVAGPDDTGPLGVTLPAIPPKAPAAPPAPGPDDTGPLGPATAPLPIPRQLPPSPRRLSPALLLGGIAAVMLIGGATLTGLAYFFLHRGVAQAPPTPSGPVAPAESEGLPPPEAEIPKSAPPAAVSPQATTEAGPAPLEVSAPAALSTPPPAPAATLPTVAPRAAKEPATLLVASQPSGARVKVGSQSGTTPSRLTLQPGPVIVVVEKDGFRRWRKRLTLASGRTQELTARLRPAAPRSASQPALVTAGDLVPLAADVTPPRRLSGDSPGYPDQAQKLKLGGSVLLEFLVTEHGKVKEPKILESAGEVLDKVSIEAVSRWRYQPAVKAGVKVKVKQQARFTFKAR
jgi:TonB family protein